MTLHTNFSRELQFDCAYGDPVNFTSLPLAGNNIAATASLYLEGKISVERIGPVNETCNITYPDYSSLVHVLSVAAGAWGLQEQVLLATKYEVRNINAQLQLELLDPLNPDVKPFDEIPIVVAQVQYVPNSIHQLFSVAIHSTSETSVVLQLHDPEIVGAFETDEPVVVGLLAAVPGEYYFEDGTVLEAFTMNGEDVHKPTLTTSNFVKYSGAAAAVFASHSSNDFRCERHRAQRPSPTLRFPTLRCVRPSIQNFLRRP
ncbi:MAG: uncharacterized protein KVP18_004653 [Porospora cf. gigantea A]|uniref:uncharacterized protein n=1 Tax=Porospora cf. gigantea A TaxID=2853593 RepID=UPI0035596B2C|nr:MAG: hypothetical protein KVP18_004653 [Porospora cf. gigantea A]